MSWPISKAYKEAKPNKPQKCYACGKRGHYRRGCENKTSHQKIGNPEPQEPSPTQPLVQETSNPRDKTQQPKVDLEPIYNRLDQPKKEVKIDDFQKEAKETKSEIGALKQKLRALQKTQSLESTSYQSNEESPSDNEVDQTVNPTAEPIQEPSKDLFLDTISRVNLHKWHSKVRIVISKDFEFEVIALIDSGADLNCIQQGIIRKSKGTSYCSMNSKSFTVHSNHSESLLLSVEIDRYHEHGQEDDAPAFDPYDGYSSGYDTD